MKLAMKIGLGIVGVLGVGVIGLITTVQLRWSRAHEAPVTGFSASDDPAVIERGRYLVQGPAHCAGCHGAGDQLAHYEETGEEIPLTGGFEIDIDPATLRPPNITPHASGIGDMTDEQLARALRYGIARDGRTLFPIMPFANLSDDDIVAIISYLRSLEPEASDVPPTQFKFLGKALLTFAIEPEGPVEPPPASVTPGRTAEYGEYLANSVANCNGCHTDRDLTTGAYIGEPFAGGLKLPHQGKILVVPNITPDGEGSRIKGWDEAAFIARVRTGKGSVPGSPMPWMPFSKMSDDDLAAIYAYLKTVRSVDRDTGPVLIE